MMFHVRQFLMFLTTIGTVTCVQNHEYGWASLFFMMFLSILLDWEV